MKIGIIGAGAIGLLCAYQLEEKYDVTLYVRSKNQYERIKQSGIYYKVKEEKKARTINVRYFEEWNGLEELTIVTVKQYQLAPIYEKMEAFGTQIKAMCFLQNGMSHIEKIKNTEVANVLIGIVEHGAMKEDAHTVIHTGIGATKLACVKGEMEEILVSLTTMTNEVFPFIKEYDYKTMMQKKLVVNSIVNGLTSILQVQNGQLLENGHYAQLANMFMNEVLEILTITEVDKKMYRDYCLDVIRNTALNKSSMLKDIEAGRPTEIDAILGYILEEAKKKQKNAPIASTIYYMIKGKEREGEEFYR
ncbi:2-dehydropantoate 2-reductase [Niallia alba]|uniref:2-dehydropantoate 2-reductase n=1 Tax=Niallia circulans TaxID=1397 RepID=A0A941GEY6_NIACI|nr:MULTISPECIES: 2-dehydropantoate 2-reductase [Niallia]MCB5235244.1 2-dehydropantoate 2-reductase [Niallia circulans]MED3795359.1 2-dehydropantoate 2-reductase [Niallia alba]